jgi:hypothetical protein
MTVTKTIVVVALRRARSYFNYAPLNKLRQLIRSSDTVLPLAIGVFLREERQGLLAVTGPPLPKAGAAIVDSGGFVALLPDALQEFLGGFVGRVLGDEATLECPFQYTLAEAGGTFQVGSVAS